MTARRLFSLGLLGCTAAVAAPALAQPEMTQDEPGVYEYARPAPPHAPVIYEHQPVIQPLPAPVVTRPVVQAVPQAYQDEQAYEVEEVCVCDPAEQSRQTVVYPPQALPYPHQAVASPGYPMPPAMPVQPQPSYDREAWLDQCRAQYGDNRGRRDGAIGGGLLGAAVGGLIGNRVADGNRLTGTLLGAGVGGVAGAVAGSAIGNSSDQRRAADECEIYLNRYLAAAQSQQGYYGYPAYAYGYGYPANGYGYGYPAYGYGQTMQMSYVPVLIQVPQRAVVRETVTEEWVEVPLQYAPAATRKVQRRPAPAPKPVKVKTRYVKTR